VRSVASAPLPYRRHCRIDVVEPNERTKANWTRCAIGANLDFCTEHLESYFFAAEWESVLYDLMLVAAAIEFCDRITSRPSDGWAREMQLRIPVHEPERWASPEVHDALHDAVGFLTGDLWSISFKPRRHPVKKVRQGNVALSNDVTAVIPFSDGLDSRAVAGLMAAKLGPKLVRVRLHSKGVARRSGRREPFTSVPYNVCGDEHSFRESSARSRGFKFAVLSGIAAYLAKVDRVIIPESGQGALGPSLVPVGQAYADYRNHPLFTLRMENFLYALIRHKVAYEFPQIWHTKGETLALFVRECADGPSWTTTRSCWQQSRQVSVGGKRRQCGVCAACMLRRMSVHAAGLVEPDDTYVWEDLRAPRFEAGVALSFKKVTAALREYAIAGTLHLDHLAGLRHSPANTTALELSVFRLSRAFKTSGHDTSDRLHRMLGQHETEWRSFLCSLGASSFVSAWAGLSNDSDCT
jgi:7-cyano-7-deazaguanine synthase in queuosine biosynthesis